MTLPHSSLSTLLLRKANLATAGLLVGVFALTSAAGVYAASTSNFTLTVNPGTLTVDIVDAAYVSVASPSVTLGAVTAGFWCQSATGTFGTASQVIYIKNPDAADNGWSVTLAGSSTTAVWDSTGPDIDFNDATGAGCTDGADLDTVGGQMAVNPSVGTIAKGACASCSTTNVTKGSSASFVEGTTDSITLLSGAAGSDDIGDWKLTGVTISQTVPGEQAAATDYDINMILSVVSS